MLKIWECAKARTVTPPSLVSVIPDRIEHPMLDKASEARSTLPRRSLIENALVMWQQNSTEIPTDITRFTTDMALKSIDHQYINPTRFIRMQPVVRVTMKADHGSNSRVVTKKIEPRESNICTMATRTIAPYSYCS